MQSDQNQQLRQAVVEPVKADRIEIVFYTDPLCCWSWAFEPQWRRLQYELREKMVFRYVMTGLLPSWKNFSDPLYSVSRPQQMGPAWMEAGETSGMPIQHRIWVEDPPASSYPACIAVKSMALQSAAAANKYLRLLREAVMTGGKNIARQEVLLQVADDLDKKLPGVISVDQFSQDLTSDRGLEAFRLDWQETQNRNISRSPTLIMRSPTKPAIMLTGYRPYPVLLDAVRQMLPLAGGPEIISIPDYKSYWGDLTQRELAEVM